MWRVHFTSEDLTRIRIAHGADPMWELHHSLHLLGNRTGEVLFDPWRLRARRFDGLRRAMLMTLAPSWGYAPDFLTPVSGGCDPAAGIDTVLRTPVTVLESDLSKLAAVRRLPGWSLRLAKGDPVVLRQLGKGMRAYFDELLAPYWHRIRRTVDDELQRLTYAMSRRGIESMLKSFDPEVMRWEPPCLLLTSKQGEVDLHLNGRGLILVPSYFAYADTTPVDIPGEPLVLAYPVRQEVGWMRAATNDVGSLEALLGRTRAAALRILAESECTTTELADQLGISLPSASNQAKILRDAGLLTSTREGKVLLHRTSALGRNLL